MDSESVKLQVTLNGLYADFKDLLGLEGNVTSLDSATLSSLLTAKGFNGYISYCFGGDGTEDTDFLSNLVKSDIVPFNGILEKLGYDFSASKGTSSKDVFANIVAGYVAAGLWFKFLANNDDAEILRVAKLCREENHLPKDVGGAGWVSLPSWEMLCALGCFLPKDEDKWKRVFGLLDEYFKPEDSETNGLTSYGQYKQVDALLNAPRYTEEVVQAVDNLLYRLEVLYNRLWDGAYIGVVLPDGSVKYARENIANSKKIAIEKLSYYLKSLSDAWYNSVQISEDKIGEGNQINTEYDMLPDLHIAYLSGKQRWLHTLKPKLREGLLKQLSSIEKEQYKDFVVQLYKTLTSGLFLIDVNDHTLQLRASYVNEADTLKYEMLNILQRNATNAQECNILTTAINSNASTKDILSITCIYNMTGFEKEILFAHKLYTGNAPVPPSLTDTVLGVKFDGSYAKVNMFQYRFLSIVAGSRSGKGTLTMSLLASLLANGEGVVYLDNKPDIGSLFWNMERSFAERGDTVKFLAIDSSKQKSEFDKAVGNRVIKNADGEVVNIQNVPSGMNALNLRPLRTYKFLQMALLLGRIRPKDPEMDKGNTFIFIDEATLLTQAIERLYLDLETGQKGKKENQELADYCNKIIDFIYEVHQGFASISLEEGEENLKFITVGQCLDGGNPKDWRVSTSPALPKIKSPKENLFFSILGATQFWLSGREQVLSRSYSLNAEEKIMANKTGSFIAHTGKPASGKFSGAAGIYANSDTVIDTKNSTLFRSYFALVNNDYNKELVESKVNEGYDSLNKFLSENKNNGYTYNFLNNVLNNNISNLQDGTFKKAMDELYNSEGLIDAVGFEGLIQSIVDLKGLDNEAYIAGLNNGYNRFNRIFEKTGLAAKHGYANLEEYLFDCAPNSFYSNKEILDMYFGVAQPLAEKPKTNMILDIDGFDAFDTPIVTQADTEIKNLENTVAEQQNTILEDAEKEAELIDQSGLDEEAKAEAKAKLEADKAQQLADLKAEADRQKAALERQKAVELEEAQRQQERKQQQDRADFVKSVMDTPPVSPNTASSDYTKYTNKIDIPVSPFATRGNGDGLVSCMNSLKDMTKLILKDIQNMVGDLRRISTFRVNANGSLSIDDILYQPTFDEAFLETLPYAIKGKVASGCLAELFDFSKVYEFKNLQSLTIENPTLAQGRCRRELGLRPRERYSVLFKAFPNLQYILAGGVEYTKNAPDMEEEQETTGFGLGAKLKNLFGFGQRGNTPDPLSDSRMNRVWESRPVRVMTNAFGWTMGVKAITLATAFFGPWGLLFGALSAAGVYGEYKNNRGQNGNQGNYTRNYSNGGSNNTRSNNGTRSQSKGRSRQTDEDDF